MATLHHTINHDTRSHSHEMLCRIPLHEHSTNHNKTSNWPIGRSQARLRVSCRRPVWSALWRRQGSVCSQVCWPWTHPIAWGCTLSCGGKWLPSFHLEMAWIGRLLLACYFNFSYFIVELRLNMFPLETQTSWNGC